MSDASASTSSPEYLTPPDAAAYLSVTTQFLAQLRSQGGSPVYFKLGSRSIRYKRSDLDAWMAQRARKSTFAKVAA